MLVYFIVPFLYKQDFAEIFKATFIPTIKFDKDFIAILVGILGTAIFTSIFFLAGLLVEVEEMKHKKRHLIVDKGLFMPWTRMWI